jgi:hypothetical protein
LKASQRQQAATAVYTELERMAKLADLYVADHKKGRPL